MRNAHSRDHSGPQKVTSQPIDNSPTQDASLSVGANRNLQLEIARRDISMSRDVLMLCLTGITDISLPVRDRFRQFLERDEPIAPWPEWHGKLLQCGERLLAHLSRDVTAVDDQTLASMTTDLQWIAEDAVSLVRSLRVAVHTLQSAYEEHRHAVESSQSAHDSSEEVVFEDDQEQHLEDGYGASDPALEQLRGWITKLDELEGRLSLAQADPHIRTIADLVSRWSSPQVAVRERTESQGIGLYAAECVSAVQAVLTPMIDAWRELVSVPRMTASEVAVAFQDEREPEVGGNDYWEHIARTRMPNSEGYRTLPPMMPIEVTEEPGRVVRFKLYAPDTSLTYCTKTWESLGAELAALKPLLAYLGTELSVSAQSPEDRVEFACALRLPGECSEPLQVDDITACLMQRDRVVLAGEAEHQFNSLVSFDVTDDAKESEIRFFTSSAALLAYENRARLGVVLSAIVKAASALGVHEVFALPDVREDDDESFHSESDGGRRSLESGDYPVILTRYSPRLSFQRAEAPHAELKETLTFVKRWMQLGDEAQQLESAGPNIDMRIRVPLSFLENPESISVLKNLSEMSVIEDINLPHFDGEGCRQILDSVRDILRQERDRWIASNELGEHERVRLRITHVPPEPFVRMVILDEAGGLWALVHFVPGSFELQMREFPHSELAELIARLPECLSQAMLPDQTLEVSGLQRQLRSMGFYLCDDLVNEICQSQFMRPDEPLSTRNLSSLLVGYLVLSSTGSTMKVAKGEEPGVILRIEDPKQTLFSKLRRKPS